MPKADVVPRMLRDLGDSAGAERLARAQHRLYGPALRWAADNKVLHADVLGRSPHPSLTDVTVGCWLGASLVDVVGGAEDRHAATLLVAAGLGAAIPTALTGAADWARMTGAPQRIGAVHALGTDVATFCLAGSLLARLGGHHLAGVALAGAGNAVMAGAGLLGAHLALVLGAARRGERGHRERVRVG